MRFSTHQNIVNRDLIKNSVIKMSYIILCIPMFKIIVVRRNKVGYCIILSYVVGLATILVGSG